MTEIGVFNPTLNGENRPTLTEERKVQFFLDRDFLEEPGFLGIHPNDNTATVWLKTRDMLEILREHGNPVNVVEI